MIRACSVSVCRLKPNSCCLIAIEQDIAHLGPGDHTGWRTGRWSLEKREGLKHKHYGGRKEGRRAAPNGQIVLVVANSFGAIGQEGQAFFRAIERTARRLGGECAGTRFGPLVESLAGFFTAQNVLAAYGRKIP